MVKFIIDPVDKLEQRHSIQIKGSVDHIQDLARSILFIEIALFASGICLVGCAALLMNSLHIKYDRQVEDSLINSKLASLGEVSAVVAHEINNPATVIKGFSELIQWQLNEPNPDLPTIRKLANDTEKAADRLLRIISGVKNLGRRGENDAFEPASLKTIVEDATMFCDGKLKKYGIDLSVQMPHEGLVLFCRPVEISQVLLNLINNACDAIETLPEKWIIIEVHDDPKTVKILVRDSGKGIPRDIQTKLFDSFYTTKAAGRGTGLGLSINLKIIRAHMGKLFIDNLCPNTQFVIELPKSMAGHEVKSNLT
jgi:C4-dicarboxylate-specific signal transduction histidine kinase